MIGHHTRWQENDDLPIWGLSVVKKKPPFFKVAEHSFHARFCSCNSTRTQGKKKHAANIERSYYLYSHTICVIFGYN